MDFKILSEKLHNDQKIRVVAHLVFWVLQFLLSWYLTAISFNIYSSFNAGVLALLALVATLNLILVYYPLVYYVLPKLRQGRYLFAVLIILLLLLGYTLINTISEELILNRCASCMLLLKGGDSGFYQFLHTPWPNRIFAKLVSFGMFFMLAFSICIPLAIKIGLQSFRQELTTMKLAKENVELEFNFLKSQVNPHFLFNSLNNIYGLILKKENAKAATTVARLSEFMRYSLYNSTNNKMPFSRELQLLKDYVELEQIRLNFTKVELDLAIERDDYDFPTLLLMPVVENAFKYSADILGAYIHIQLKISDDKLVFKVENTVDVDRQLQSTGGIGLQNLKKRLNLYYPDRHHYEQGLSETMYVAQININL